MRHKRTKASYSSEKTQQDLWVIDTLGEFENGFFVDLGAADGFHASNTYLLESKYRWKGICVEPHPMFFQSLCHNRDVICEEVCVADYNGECQFTASSEYPYFSGITGTLKHYKKNKWGEPNAREIDRKVVTLEALLDRHNAPAVIDFLSIDIEGGEVNALSMFPFDRYRFRTISIEGRFANDILLKAGYRQVDNPRSSVDWEYFFVSDPE